jgi:Mitochondrial carrier protein
MGTRFLSVFVESSLTLTFLRTSTCKQFYTYNVLSSSVLVQALIPRQFRNAAIGIASSVVSDSVVNVFRVIKTTKQSLGSKQNASYLETVRIILAADGYKGLFGRGLRTRIYANALQSVVFTVVWRGLIDYWKRRKSASEEEYADHK